MKLAVEVKISQWAWGDGDESHVLSGGLHSLSDASKDFVAALAAAAAGDPSVIEIVSADDAAKKTIAGAVESDKDSLKALDAAVKSGAWHEGNLESAIAAEKGKLEAALEAGDEAAARAADFRMAQAADALLAVRGEA